MAMNGGKRVGPMTLNGLYQDLRGSLSASTIRYMAPQFADGASEAAKRQLPLGLMELRPPSDEVATMTMGRAA